MRALVVYGSSRGGTAGLAEWVAEALTDRGLDTAIGSAAQVEDIDGYDAVVVGGALYNNRWHTDAVDFVHRFPRTLRELSVWLFSSGPLDDSARSSALAPVPHVRDLARALDVRGHMTFGGVLEKQSGGRLGALLSYGKVGDWRDRAQVEQWVDRIVAQLAEPRTTIVLPDAEPDSAAFDEGSLARIRRMLSLDEIDDDAGLDVLL